SVDRLWHGCSRGLLGQCLRSRGLSCFGQLGGRRAWLWVHVEQLAQRLAAAEQARSNCPDRNPENSSGVVVAHAFEADEQDDLSFLRAQARQRVFELSQLTGGGRVRRRD